MESTTKKPSFWKRVNKLSFGLIGVFALIFIVLSPPSTLGEFLGSVMATLLFGYGLALIVTTIKVYIFRK